MAIATHKGSCHCGAVRYTVEIDTDAEAIECNCSICGRSGTLLLFTSMEQFKLESGEDNLTSYRFNNQHIDHVFCKTCGIKSFAKGKGRDGKPMAAINARCLDDVDVFTQKRKQFNGKSL
jgi:hypothetical protein